MGQRNYLDTVLPPEFLALSSIEEELGWFPPDPSFLEIKRKKWTIPCAACHVATSTLDFTLAHTLMKPSIIRPGFFFQLDLYIKEIDSDSFVH